MKVPCRLLSLLPICLLLSTTARAVQELRWPAVFADHAVLQAAEPIVVWGRAAPGEVVSVSLGGETRRATSAADGRWRVELPPQPITGEPLVLEAHAGDEQLVAEDVLVGELWLASGQSNMVWPVLSCDDLEASRAGARDRRRVRLFHAPPAPSEVRVDDVAGEWIVAAPEAVERFSAVGWHFARVLEEELEVPVGIVLVARGGTSVEAWTPRDVLEELPEARDMLEAWDLARDEVVRGEAWAAPDVDDSTWPTFDLPATFTELGLEAGVAWFRRPLELPAAWAGETAVLDLGRTDDTDSVWVDGTAVGGTSRVAQDSLSTFTVPEGARLQLAVRIRNHGGEGGFVEPPERFAMHLEGDPEQRVSLAGPWRGAVGSPVPIPDSRHRPGHFWTGMLEPLASLRVRGVIWYQGERNARAPSGYDAVFGAMIEAWRARLDRPVLPFLFVQLPNLETSLDWPRLREAQLAVHRRTDATGIVVAIDAGDPRDLHPRNKRRVGERLARLALHDVYGREDLVAASPIAEDTTFEGGVGRVHFATGGAPLAVREGGALQGFALAGEDRVFHSATARIVDERTVLVRCESVEHPVALRYAWASNPATANLQNAAGLPASPFRTDAWED